MGLTKSQRNNIKMDAIFTQSIILKHEYHGEYSEAEYRKAQAEYNDLKARYPRLINKI